MKKPSLSALLEKNQFPAVQSKAKYKADLHSLQLRMFRAQQGIWHQNARAIIVIEGFDASGKGGAIRRLTGKLDPRGFQVHPIGPPSIDETGRHYLHRFWNKLPSPGSIAIFDRSWYGRVLVERVDKLTPEVRWRRAYEEIREFEHMLRDDGVEVIKVFLAVSKDEQHRRFEKRLIDPYKQWKIGGPDLKARSQWAQYVQSVDDMFGETHTRHAPWKLVAANDKGHARIEVLKLVTKQLARYADWMDEQAERRDVTALQKALKDLK